MPDTPVFDGLITFFASHHAMRAEKVLKRNGYAALLVPGPREISPNCGVAMQFEYRYAEQVRQILRSNSVDPKAAEIGFFSIQPVYDWRQPKRKLVGYRVNTNVSLKLTQFGLDPGFPRGTDSSGRSNPVSGNR